MSRDLLSLVVDKVSFFLPITLLVALFFYAMNDLHRRVNFQQNRRSFRSRDGMFRFPWPRFFPSMIELYILNSSHTVFHNVFFLILRNPSYEFRLHNTQPFENQNGRFPTKFSTRLSVVLQITMLGRERSEKEYLKRRFNHYKALRSENFRNQKEGRWLWWSDPKTLALQKLFSHFRYYVE